jgi:hypothetical protein
MARTPLTEPEIYQALEDAKAENATLRAEVTRGQSMLQEIGEANDALRRQAAHAIARNEELTVQLQQSIAQVEDLRVRINGGGR